MEYQGQIRNALNSSIDNGYAEFVFTHNAFELLSDMIDSFGLVADGRRAEGYNTIMAWKAEHSHLCREEWLAPIKVPSAESIAKIRPNPPEKE